MKTVFLVEDNHDNADLIEDLLCEDYTVEWFSAPDRLLEYVAGTDVRVPDVFLLDINLPGMDGIELLRRLRDNETVAKVPAIALTAHAMSTDRDRFFDAGFNGYVTKPIIDEEALVEEIERLTPSSA